MKKRMILMLTVLAVVMIVAPLAMADHCKTCRGTRCWPATVPAYYFCDDTSGTCVLSGWGCSGPHPFVEEEPFAAEFIVASVDRVDGRQPAPAGETRVASLEKPAPSLETPALSQP